MLTHDRPPYEAAGHHRGASVSPGRARLAANQRTAEMRPLEGEALRDFDWIGSAGNYEGGWAGISWPKEYGGRGSSLAQQLIWYEECARAGAPVRPARCSWP